MEHCGVLIAAVVLHLRLLIIIELFTLDSCVPASDSRLFISTCIPSPFKKEEKHTLCHFIMFLLIN